MKKFLFILFVLPAILFADNIHLKNGSVIINVKIIKNENGWISYERSDGKIQKIKENVVAEIERLPFDPDKETKFLKKDYMPRQVGNYVERLQNFKLFPISIIAFALSYDYFNDASDAEHFKKDTEILIANYENINNPDLEILNRYYKTKDKYEKMIKRKKIMAFIFLGVGIINTYISLKPVKIEARENRIGLTINF